MGQKKPHSPCLGVQLWMVPPPLNSRMVYIKCADITNFASWLMLDAIPFEVGHTAAFLLVDNPHDHYSGTSLGDKKKGNIKGL